MTLGFSMHQICSQRLQYNRYANTAITNAGLAIAPAAGLTKLEYFNLLTFTNLACSDPSGYQLFGTMDYLTSGDNSLGTNENWVLLSEGNLNLPTERSAWSSDIRVDAEDFYRCYKLIFTGIRDASDTNATVVHISEMQFYGESENQSTGDAILIQGDKAIPRQDFLITKMIANIQKRKVRQWFWMEIQRQSI